MGELEGVRGAWGYPEGGMGAVSAAIAKSALAAGAELYTDSPVAAITTGPGGAASRGVPTHYRRTLAAIDYTSPVCKINIAVNKIPNFLADPNTTEGAVMPHHRATIHLNCEESGMIEEAYRDAKEQATFSRRPMIEMTIPSSLDATLAPLGHHVCLVFTQYAPYTLAGREWDEETRREYGEVVVATIEQYAPGFRASIVGLEVLPPPELERIFGLAGGAAAAGAGED